MRKVVVDPKTFVDTIAKLATTNNLYVMKWSDQYPQMVDHLWRADVMAELAKHHVRTFQWCKFYGPDEIDDEWMFIAAIDHDHRSIDYNPGPSTWDEWLFMLSIVSVIALTISGLIYALYMGAIQ